MHARAGLARRGDTDMTAAHSVFPAYTVVASVFISQQLAGGRVGSRPYKRGAPGERVERQVHAEQAVLLVKQALADVTQRVRHARVLAAQRVRACARRPCALRPRPSLAQAYAAPAMTSAATGIDALSCKSKPVCITACTVPA